MAIPAAAAGAAGAAAISPELLGSIISSASATGMSGLGFLVNQNQSSLSYSRQRRLMDYQNELYRQNLAEDRIYNSPVNTMARYKEAGLNPNLIYGNGTEAATGFGPSASAPPMSQIQLNGLSLVKDLMDVQQAKANIEYTKAQTNALNNRDSREQDLHVYKLSDAKFNESTQELRREGIQLSNDAMNDAHKEAEKRVSLLAQQISKGQFDDEHRKEMYDNEMRKLNEEIENLKQRTANLKSEKEGQDFKNDFNKETRQKLIDSVEYETAMKKMQKEIMENEKDSLLNVNYAIQDVKDALRGFGVDEKYISLFSGIGRILLQMYSGR